MHVGVFGGTFDPPHIGHLIIAQEAYEQAHLDRVVFMPAPAPPHKHGLLLSPFPLRLAMVRAAVEGDPRFCVSDLEATLPVPSYTVETLRALRRAEPAWQQVDLIIGSDSLLELPTWKTPDEVLTLAGLVVYPREGFPVAAAPEEYAKRARLLEAPRLLVSSTDLRRRIAERRSLRYWVGDGVLHLIKTHGLYAMRPEE